MDRIGSEQRALRLGLASFLSSNSWAGLSFSEGWETIDVSTPLINIYVLDNGKENLELGSQASTHKLLNRTLQVDVYMETENRVRELCDDIMDYLDQSALTITDLFTTSGVGYMSFPNSETIHADFLPPTFNNPEILRWRGVVRGDFEAYYPNGGNPF